MHEAYREAVERFVEGARDLLGEDLLSIVLYGSVARGTPREDSDVDLLLVARGLPPGVRPRRRYLEPAEGPADTVLRRVRPHGILSVVSRTPEELAYGGPLFYDMTVPEERQILFDRDDFMASWLEDLRRRMQAAGARRAWTHGHPYWILTPDDDPFRVVDF
jgi:predicted nucleotidyltransferase